MWFYKDRYTSFISPNVDNVFDRRALPIELEHERVMDRAVIMIHGYPSTPHSYDWASKRFYEEQYDVFVPLLPGFGTEPKELYKTTFTQWYNYVENFYKEKRAHYKHLYVIGTSMGGSIALKLGEQFSNSPLACDAVATIAAPVFLNDIKLGIIHKWSFYFMRLAALFTPAINPKIHTGSEWINDGEELWIGYGGAFVRGGVSFMHALKTIRAELSKINVPLYLAHDQNDKTVNFQNLAVIKEKVSSKNVVVKITKLTSDHNRHTLLLYPSIQKELADDILTFFSDVYRAKKEQ